MSLLILRTLPKWSHRAVSLILPPIWKNYLLTRQARRLLLPDIHRWQTQVLNGEKLNIPALLPWMIETAQGSERDPDHLVELVILVSLASIHTTSTNAVHCLYDLASHPEYIDPLRQEITQIASSSQGWNKASYARLWKLDSFIKESQRFNPPSLLSYHRVMQSSHTLSDGTTLRKGSHICLPAYHIQNSPDITPYPATFDALRYHRLRSQNGEGHKHQLTTATSENLNFGYGRHACPGRFFAALEIKSILVRLIMGFDFGLLQGEERPASLGAY
ncbi:MAG: hypothetical protein Q9162_005063, partial [Coniocarpon cinnabarinum]